MTLSVAVIGAGFMGALWARALHEHPLANVGLIVDVERQRGKSLAERCNARHIDQAEAAIADASVDAVVICTPEHLHRDAALACLAENKPLAIEKPTAHSIEIAEEIAKAAAASTAPCLAGHVLRFEPRYAAVKQAIDEGKIGKVLSVRHERIGIDADRQRLSARTTVALYYAVHELDIARWFAGDFVHIDGEGDADLLSGSFKFASGAHGTIQVGWCLPDKTPGFGMAGFTVVGENGTMSVNQGANGISIVSADGLKDTDVAYAPEIHGKIGGMLAREVDHFVDVALGNAEPICTAADGAEAVRASNGLEQSAKSGTRVKLG